MNRSLIIRQECQGSQVFTDFFKNLSRQHGDISIQKFTEPKFCLEKTPWLIIQTRPDNQSIVGQAEDF